jgi:hypothetical protein
MKPQAKIVFLSFALMLPYIAFMMFLVFRVPRQPLPTWFLYFALCYFFGSIVFIAMMAKKFRRKAPPASAGEKRGAIRAARLLGFLFLLGPLGYILSSEVRKQPIWMTMLALSWTGFLSWVCFHSANAMELKNRQDAERQNVVSNTNI